MIRFECDYNEGAHPRILSRLAETNMEQCPGYGLDPHSEAAREYIRRECGGDMAVEFVCGGTQANALMCRAALRPYEGAVAAASGHIAVHEAGAVEAGGHKVLTLPSDDGKLTAEGIDALSAAYDADPNAEHTVKPGLVYISFPTETGTLYTISELRAISAVCRRRGLALALDGARLGYGLAVKDCGVMLRDIAALCDIFYIGGTKVGALLGEAMVIPNREMAKGFRSVMKQSGAMLAKGRLLGVQFETLFEDGLYYDISGRALALADMIRDAFAAKGFSFRYASPTNQIFPVLPEYAAEKLAEKYAFSVWEKLPEGVAARFCTSWATTEENAAALCRDIRSL